MATQGLLYPTLPAHDYSVDWFTLQDAPGGYLCREQESGLSYMLAFDTGRGALEWCLVRGRG